MGSPTTSTPYFPAWSTQGSFTPLPNSALIRTPGASSNSRILNCTRSTGRSPCWPRSPTIYRPACSRTVWLWGNAGQKSFITTVPTFISRLGRPKMINSLASAKKTAPFRSWRWGFSWTGTASPWLSASIREMKMNSSPLYRLKTNSWKI